MSAVLVLGLAVSSGAASPAEAEGVTLSAFGTARIDGEIGAGEWDRAARLPFEMNVPGHDGGGTVTAILYVMTDSKNLYAAVGAPGSYHSFGPSMEFDNDDDGTWPEDGDDALVFYASEDSLTGWFADDVRTPCPPGSGSSGLCAPEDTDPVYPDPGTKDGTAEGFTSEALGSSFIEMSHPLDSADDAHDFSLRPGDTVGFFLDMRVISTASGPGCGYPECTGDTRVPARGYAHIRVATAEVSPQPTPTATLSPVTGADTAWSAFGTAAVDGRFGSAEWAPAARIDLVADLPASLGPGQVPVGIHLMNDDRDLYVAVRIGRPFATATVTLEVDNDGDGPAPEVGDDAIVVNGHGASAGFGDDVRAWCPAGVTIPLAGTCGLADNDPRLPSPGTIDGAAAAGDRDGTYLVEVRHPLDSADDAHDVSLHPGDVIGLTIRVFFATTTYGCGDGNDCTGQAFTYARIRVADARARHLPSRPTATAVVTPKAGASAWWTADATVTLTGAPGVRRITYWASPTVDAGVIRPGADLPLASVSGGRATIRVGEEGRTIVRWYATDGAGVRGPWQSTEVRIDRMPPEVSPPVVVFVHDAILGTGTAATNVQWAGIDGGSQALRYILQESRDAGPWLTVRQTGASVTSGGGVIVPRHLTVGSTYRYRVRTTDAAGNAGEWRAGPVYHVNLVDSRDPRIVLSGAWRTVADRDAVGGSTLVATEVGATASVAFAGSSVALVAPTAKRRGSATLRLDGASAGPVKLARPAADGRIVWRAAWSTAGPHALVLTTLSASRFDVDAFLVLEEQAPVQAVFQAERCLVEVSGRDRPPTTQDTTEAVGLELRGEGQLHWSPPGAAGLQILLPVSVTGRYAIYLFLARGPDSGRISVLVPGGPPPTFDLYAADPSGPFAVGILPTMLEGPTARAIEFSIDGRNPASAGFAIGIDRIVLTPAP